MVSALDCYMKAARYLEQARASHDDVARALLVEAAKTWRNLARKADAIEARTATAGTCFPPKRE